MSQGTKAASQAINRAGGETKRMIGPNFSRGCFEIQYTLNGRRAWAQIDAASADEALDAFYSLDDGHNIRRNARIERIKERPDVAARAVRKG